MQAQDGNVSGNVHIDDDNLYVDFAGEVTLADEDSHIDANVVVDRFRPLTLGAHGKLAENTLRFKANASFVGNRLDNATGLISVEDFAMTEPSGNGITLNHLELTADNDTNEQSLTLSSDYLSGTVEGSYDFVTLVPWIKRLLSSSMPSLPQPSSSSSISSM